MKARGFTLIELLFCMALIGIVLSFGGWVYQVFHGFQYRYLAHVEKTYDLIQLQDRLQKDFAGATNLESFTPDCFFLMNQPKEEGIQYCMTETFLLRSHRSYLDTFKLRGRWNIEDESFFIQDLDSELTFYFHLPPRSQAKALTLNANQP